MAAWAKTTEQFPLRESHSLLDDQKNIQIYGTRKFMQCLESSSLVPIFNLEDEVYTFVSFL
jgi:hypothetical protein